MVFSTEIVLARLFHTRLMDHREIVPQKDQEA
jgi:hypothetical protein